MWKDTPQFGLGWPSHTSSAQKPHTASGYHIGQCSSVTCQSHNHWAVEKETFMIYYMCVCVGGGRESGRQQALGDWRAVVKQLPRVTRRGSTGNRRAPQIHKFTPSHCLPFPTASQQSSGCSWATVLDRGWTRALLLLSPLDATCGLCATLSSLSLSSHVPRVLFMFLPQSYAILHLERSIFFSNPASYPTFCL